MRAWKKGDRFTFAGGAGIVLPSGKFLMITRKAGESDHQISTKIKIPEGVETLIGLSEIPEIRLALEAVFEAIMDELS